VSAVAGTSADPAQLAGGPVAPALEREYDVLVAGGGNAGLCAAIAARRAGARVLLVEAAPRWQRAGNSRHTRNLRLAHARANAALTGPYPEAEFLDDLLRVTEGATDPELARLTIDRSTELWDWLVEQGVRFQPALAGTLGLERTNAFFLGGGKAAVNALYRTAGRLGVEVVYDASVESLGIERGIFQSARVVHGGADYEVAARTLVAATGGFEANREWLAEHWGEAAHRFVVRGTPFNRGVVLRALLAAGVAPVGDPRQCHAIAVDARAPASDGGIVTRLDCVVFGVVVDRNGRRFYDEGEDLWPRRYAIWGRLIADLPEQIAHVVIDAKAIDLFMPSLYPPARADTLGELAGRLGLDPDALERSVADFNASCRTGPAGFDPRILDDCSTHGLDPPKSHWARPIDTPPFYGYSLRPGITFTYLGVRVDAAARMQLADGSASENLFAAGEIMAGNVLGRGYLAGLGMTLGAVFGRIAGTEAARRAAA